MVCCYKCARDCVAKEDKTALFGYACDICTNITCAECTGVSASEIRVLVMKSRSLYHFCLDCRDNIFKNILEVNNKFANLEEELKNLKCSKKINEIEQKTKAIEIEVKKLKQNKQDDRFNEFNSKLKLIEERIESCKPEKFVAPSLRHMESALTKCITETLNNCMKDISNSIAEIIKDPNMGALNQSIEEKANFSDNSVQKRNDKTVIPQNVGLAVMEAQTKNTLNKYININKDLGGNSQIFRPPMGSLKNNRVVKGISKEVSKISAAERVETFYIGNLSTESSVEQLKAYLLENEIPVVACEQLTSRQMSTSSAYKLSILPQQVENILDAKLWPENVIVKPFRFPRQRHSFNKARRNFPQRQSQVWPRR